MATRMQQRRGTAAQWISTNSGNGPILNAGEIGYETDTNKFKIGDGTNHWVNLDYFIDASSTVNPAFGSSITFEGATNNSFETTVQVTDPTADRTITFPDATGTVVLADGSGNVTVSGDLTVSGTTTTINSTTINATTGIVFEGVTANAFETTLAVTDPTADRTLTLPDSTGTIATEAYVDSAVSGVAVDEAALAGTGLNWNAGTSKLDVDTTTIQTRVADVSDTEIGYLNGVTSAIQTQLDDKSTASKTETLTNKTLTSPTVSGLTLSDSGIVIEGSSADAHETTLIVTNPTADRTITFPDETGTVQLRVTDVSDTEIGYLNGVTSAIQTQMNAKAPIASPTFTGSVTLAADPASALQAATKQYVDNTASGIVAKPQVLGATTANIDATYNNGTAGVGATLTHNTNGAFPAAAGGASGWAVGKGILVKNQTNKAQNGRYYVSDMGSASTPYILTRCTYCDEASEIPGAYIFVQDGTFAGTGWIQVVADPATFVVGTDNIDVFQFSGSGTITAGTGITVNGNQVSIDTAVTQARVENVSDTEIGYLNGVTSSIQTQLDAKIAKADITAKGAILVGTGAGTYASQAVGSNGQVLTANSAQADGVEWTTISGYNAPTLGSTSIASGATVTTIAGLTLTSPVLNTPTLTLSTSTSTTDAVVAWDSTNKKLKIGNGTTSLDFASSTVITNAQAASYTIVLADKDKLVEISNASANTLTVPANSSVAYPIGSQINILQTGAGQTTVAAAGGVTINATPGLKLRTQWSSATLIKRAENTWVLVGDLSA